jgi:hypothetical protein
MQSEIDEENKSVSRQQKWHRLRILVRGDLQAVSQGRETA